MSTDFSLFSEFFLNATQQALRGRNGGLSRLFSPAASRTDGIHAALRTRTGRGGQSSANAIYGVSNTHYLPRHIGYSEATGHWFK